LYDKKIHLTRVVAEGDPIPNALRKVYGGYRHIGQEQVWPVSDVLKLFSKHEVALYLDLSLKDFYLRRHLAKESGFVLSTRRSKDERCLYVASVENDLPEVLVTEFPALRESLIDEYDQILPGVVLGTEGKNSQENFENAAEAGCNLLVRPEIHALRTPQSQNEYYISLSQTVYNVEDGNVINVSTYGSNTKRLTPLTALLRVEKSMSRESDLWTGKNSSH